MNEAQLRVVLLSLAQAAWGGCSPLEAALAARDGAMICIMWATMMRGHEVGGLQFSGPLLLDGSSAVSSLVPEVSCRQARSGCSSLSLLRLKRQMWCSRGACSSGLLWV